MVGSMRVKAEWLLLVLVCNLCMYIQDTVYEYYVDVKTKNWMLWEEKLKGTWRYPSK